MEPVYISKASARNLWQEYRVYPDRVELTSRILLRTFVIPANEIVEAEIRPPIVIGDLFRGRSFSYVLALKLDLADLYRHVALHRKSGVFKHLRFTPNHPEDFVTACRTIMQ